MKIIKLYILMFIGICYVDAQCQQFSQPGETLQADNEYLSSLLGKMEAKLEQQLQKNIQMNKDFLDIEEKLLEFQMQLMEGQQEHVRAVETIIASSSPQKCNHSLIYNRSMFMQDYEKFSKLQNIISSKLNIMPNDIDDEEKYEEDNDNFCGDFYTKTVSQLRANLTILENIDTKLDRVTKKFEKSAKENKSDLDAKDYITKRWDKKVREDPTEESQLCIRTKDNNMICTNPPYPTSCAAYDASHCSQGKCLIKNFLYGSEPFQVTCDDVSEGGGWLIVQRRINGSVDFFRDWSDYKIGFGNQNGEFWLGLDKLHALTTTQPMELLIELKDHKDVMRYAKYTEFLVANETQLYELKAVSGYHGNAGDAFSLHRGNKFTTKDRDNDVSHVNCAKDKKGAWWYNNCHWTNLNGFYYDKEKATKLRSGDGINWSGFHGYKYSLKFVQMMIRPKKE